MVELSPHEFFTRECIPIPLSDAIDMWLSANGMTSTDVRVFFSFSESLFSRARAGHEVSPRVEREIREVMNAYPSGAYEVSKKLHEEKFGKEATTEGKETSAQ